MQGGNYATTVAYESLWGREVKCWFILGDNLQYNQGLDNRYNKVRFKVTIN